MSRLFGTDGIRGVANVAPVTPEGAMTLGRAAVDILASSLPSQPKPRIVIGRDTRLSGPMLEAALVAGLCSAGADVVTLGVFPSAGVAYLTRYLGAAAGIVVSASHNPYGDNGIKFFSANGAKLEDAQEDALETYLARSHPETAPPTGHAVGSLLAVHEPVQTYVDFLKSTLPHKPPVALRIGLDCAHGAASVIAPALFSQLGAEVHLWHAAPDGTIINQQCGSQHPEFLQQKVIEAGLDVGFAFDGDADRLIAIDHQGHILDGDHILAVCANMLAVTTKPVPHCVVSTVMANLGLERALQSLGMSLVKTQVGDKHVLQEMRQQGAVLGGEQSGHIIFLSHHPTGDGLLTAVQLLNAMLTRQRPLAELAKVLPKCPQVLLNVRLRERRDPLTLPRVQHVVARAEEDLGAEGRVLVRLSGTESVARVMVEGSDTTQIDALAHHIAQTISHEIGLSS